MNSGFRPSRLSDLLQIKLLGINAFNASGNSPFIGDDALQWKYWQHRADFEAPRSFVIEHRGRVVAHAGVWPITLNGERGAHIIDWMAAIDAPAPASLCIRPYRAVLIFCIPSAALKRLLIFCRRLAFPPSAPPIHGPVHCVRSGKCSTTNGAIGDLHPDIFAISGLRIFLPERLSQTGRHRLRLNTRPLNGKLASLLTLVFAVKPRFLPLGF